MGNEADGGQSGGGNGVLKVLGIGCLIIFLFVAAAGVYLAMNARSLASRGAQAMITAVIEDTDLPAEQKAALTERSRGLTDAFRDKEITLEELGRVGEALANGPLAAVAIVGAIQTQVIESIPDSEEERSAAVRAFQRYSRGVAEGSIPPSHFQDLVRPLTDEDAEGDRPVLNGLDAAHRAQFLEALMAAVEEAGVPDEPYEVDFVALFDQAVSGNGG